MAGTDRYLFDLFISGRSQQSQNAIRNLRGLCEARLMGRYEIRVVDILNHPEKARENQIIVVPVLIKRLPKPESRMVGDLSSIHTLARALGIEETVQDISMAEDLLEG